MTVLTRPRGAARSVSFYDGPGYAPDNIGNWVAVTDRDLPWHTIGKSLESSRGTGTSVDHLMTASEVLEATGYDIEVRKIALKTADTGTPVPKVFVTGYEDPDTLDLIMFGSVSDRYEVVQPAEALSFFDEVVKGIDGAGYSAAWNMREKSMMGVTIHLPDEVVVDPSGANDRTAMHLLGVNSFDGSTGIAGVITGTRWFCLNQMAPVLRRAKKRFSLRHTKNVKARAAEAARMIGLANEYVAELDAMANALYQAPMSDPQFERFLNKIPIFAIPSDASDLVKGRITERRAEALECWRAPHNENITGTRWGALNVVAEWAEWGRNVKGSPRTGTTPERQRAIGTLVSPHVTAPVDMAADILTTMR